MKPWKNMPYKKKVLYTVEISTVLNFISILQRFFLKIDPLKGVTKNLEKQNRFQKEYC